jgi:hypothetical protein
MAKTKEKFLSELQTNYTSIAEKTVKLKDFSTGEDVIRDKYRKLRTRYNEREGLVEGMATLVEEKLAGLEEEAKNDLRAKILVILSKSQTSEVMESFLEERADAGIFSGIGKEAAKRAFLDNANEAVPGTILGNLVTLIDNAVATAKDPKAKTKPISEITVPETGNNYYFYPNLKDAMLGSLNAKLEAKLKDLGSGKSPEDQQHLTESILDSLDNEKLDKLLGVIAGKNGYVRSYDAKDLKTAKSQLKAEDAALEAIVSEAVTKGQEKEADIAAGKKTRGDSPSLEEPSNNTFLKTFIYGMMLSAQAIQGYNAIAQSPYRTSPANRTAGTPRGDSTALVTSGSTGTGGPSSMLDTSPIPGPYAMVTQRDAAALKKADVSDTSLALRSSHSSPILETSSIPGPGTIVTQADAATLSRTDSMNASLVSGAGGMVTSGSSVFFNNLRSFTQAFIQNPNELSRITPTQKEEVFNFLQQLAVQGRTEIAPVSRESAQSTALVTTSQTTTQNEQVISGYQMLTTEFLRKLSKPDQQRFLPVFQDLGSTLRDISLSGNDLSQLLGVTVNTASKSPQLMIDGPSTGVSVTDLALVPTGTEVSKGQITPATLTPLVNEDLDTAPFYEAAGRLAQNIKDLNNSLRPTVTGVGKTVVLGKQERVDAITIPIDPLDSVSITDTSGTSGQGRGTALGAVSVSDTTATPTNALDAIQVTSTDPEVTTSKAKATAKSRKPILSPDDTFAAYREAPRRAGLFSVSYDNKIKDLHELKADLGALKETLEELKQKPNYNKDAEFIEKQYKFAKKQFEVTKEENFLRKGRETGGQYREHQLALLEAAANKPKAKKQDKQLAAEHRILLANTGIQEANMSLEDLTRGITGEIDDKALAIYKSTILNSIKAEEEKAKGIKDYLAAGQISTSEKQQEQQKASDELITHLQEAANLDKAGFAAFEKKRQELSVAEDNSGYVLGSSARGGEGISTSSYHSKSKKEATTVTAPQEPSPYEIWLCKEAEKKYEFNNQGKKFDELSEEEQHNYNKQYVYANRSAKINEYEESLSSAGKVTGRSSGTSKTFELSGNTAIKFEVGFDNLLTPTVDGDVSKLNAVVRVQRKRSNGTLSTVSDMIEFKDGKIVGFHLNTEKDLAGPTTSQLNIGAIESLAKNLNKAAEKSAPTVEQTAPTDNKLTTPNLDTPRTPTTATTTPRTPTDDAALRASTTATTMPRTPTDDATLRVPTTAAKIATALFESPSSTTTGRSKDTATKQPVPRKQTDRSTAPTQSSGTMVSLANVIIGDTRLESPPYRPSTTPSDSSKDKRRNSIG